MEIPGRRGAGKTFRPDLRRLFVTVLLALGVLAGGARSASANASIQQGGSATFAPTGTDAPQGVTWDIFRNGSFVANTYATNGWTVSYSGGNFTVGAPSGATIATNYEIRDNTGSGNKSAYFDVVAAVLALSSVSVSPPSVLGGQSAQCTVTLNQAAPSGGISVALASSNVAVATVPASVTVSQGQTSATCTITTLAVASSTNVTFTGTYSAGSKTATLTVLQQPVLTGLSASSVNVTGGTGIAATVSLGSAAPPSGVVVALSSDTPGVASVPASVTVGSGLTSATFTVTTSPVATISTATLSATYNGVTKTLGVTVNPPTLTGFTVSPNSVTGGSGVVGAVTLSGPAYAGLSVPITCSDGRAISLPATAVFAANATTATVAIWTSTVNFTTTVTLTASYGGNALNASVTLSSSYLRAYSYLPIGSTTNSTPPTNVFILAMTWNNTTSNSFVLSRYDVTSGVVASTPTYTVTLPSTQVSYLDNNSVTSGNTYYYKLTDASTPPNFLSDDMVIPYNIAATDNQTVDSRIDPRFATVHYLDFPFGASTYHGGLFVGYAQDNAKISRSLLKFNLARPVNGDFRMGIVNAFNTGAVTSGNNSTSVPIGCQAISNSSWTSSNAAWSQLFGPSGNPGSSFNSASAQNATTVTVNPGSPLFYWSHWLMSNDIFNAITTNQPLSVVLASTSENSNGWAYFGKSGYVAGASPCVTYLYDYVVPITLTLSPNQINGVPSTITATVTLNGIGLGDNQNVTMTVSPNPANAFTIQNVSPSQGFPYILPANGFLSSRTFSFMANGAAMTSPCGNPLNYTVTATCNGVSASANLQIVLPPCPH